MCHRTHGNMLTIQNNTVLLCSVLIIFWHTTNPCFGLRDVAITITPAIVKLGEDATLKCSYDLENAPLYCVKWYRGHHEFYRYSPTDSPSTKVFPFDGINIDLKQSNQHQVILRNMKFNLSGKFTCEVTTDAPTFSSKSASRDLVVVALPNGPPTITSSKTFYEIGDILRANCTTPPARPAPSLTFHLNNVPVCEKCNAQRYGSTQDMWWNVLSMELPLFPSHFQNHRLVLKCTATIGDLYKEHTQLSLAHNKDPTPARVTQSSGAAAAPPLPTTTCRPFTIYGIGTPLLLLQLLFRFLQSALL